MLRALSLAEQAVQLGEVPVGAVLIDPATQTLLGEGFNRPITSNDATAHAEVMAIREACSSKDNYRLPGTTLYVTLEPCSMCAGALIHARVQRVVIATKEPRAGAAGSLLNVLNHPGLNHRCEVSMGLRAQESAQLLTAFFKARR